MRTFGRSSGVAGVLDVPGVDKMSHGKKSAARWDTRG